MIRHLKIARDTAVKCRSQAMVTLKTLIINAPAALRDTLDQISGKIALIRYIAAFRPGAMTSTIASAKTALRALAQRWLTLHEEIQLHDKVLEQLVVVRAPTLLASHGIATMTAAEMLLLVGDDPARIRSEVALAKLCGVCPIPASSGKTNRFRLNRGRNRQANAALYRVAIVRMRNHPPTLAYVSKKKMEGKSNRETIRCLKRYIVREIFTHLCPPKAPSDQRLTNIGASTPWPRRLMALQGRGDPLSRTLAIFRGRRVRHARMGRLVRPPAAPRTYR